MIRSQGGRTATRTAGTILTRTARTSTRVPRRPAPPLPKPAAKPAKQHLKKPSAFNNFNLEPVIRGNRTQNIPSKFLTTIRNRQVSILGKEPKEHKLLKRAITRQMQKKPVPKKKKSPERPIKERQGQILLKPNEMIGKSPPNVPLSFIFSILSQTNPEFRKMLRKSLVAKAKAKYLDSRSIEKGSASGISRRRYSKFHNLKVRQQRRPIASA